MRPLGNNLTSANFANRRHVGSVGAQSENTVNL
jgi:hypothetical protein